MIRHALTALAPAFLLLLAGLWGGVFPGLALASMTVVVALADRGLDRTPLPPLTQDGRALLWVMAGMHVAVLAAGLWGLVAAPDRSWGGLAALFVALGLWLGQVSNSAAHEMIHASGRGLRRAGRLIYGSVLFGHHGSAHLLVHHPHSGTAADPNSAPAGMGFYRFWPRAWLGSYRAGWRAEARRLRHRRGLRKHPYLGDLGLGLAMSAGVAGLGLASGQGALRGLGLFLGLCAYVQMQLLLADYVQHYGLRRKMRPSGRAEPSGPEHAWNAPHRYSASMMLNAPRHSDHHQSPSRPWPGLRLDPATMPILPYALPIMAVLALVPPLWRRVMDRRLSTWQAARAPRPSDIRSA